MAKKISKKQRNKQRGQQVQRAGPVNTPQVTSREQQSMTPNAQPPSDKPDLLSLIESLENARGTKVIAYWLSDVAQISDAVVPQMYDHLDAIGQTEAIDLFLFTRGGSTVAPWRLVSLIREFCNQLSVLVPYRAHSAGTNLALGADEIVMTPLGELGPIDPSRRHPLLPLPEGSDVPEPVSVQDMQHAMQFIKQNLNFDESSVFTSDAMANIVTSLFTHVHPLAIGAIEQTYELAKQIATRCLETHMDKESEGDRIQSIVNALCDGFKDHSYQINRKEAKELGLKVVEAPPDVETAMMNLLKFYMARDRGQPPNPPRAGNRFIVTIGWLDSRSMQHRVENEILIEQNDQARTIRDQWVSY